jgi:hypothetical protein
MRGVNHGELVLVPEQSQATFRDLQPLPTHAHTHGHRAHTHSLGTPEHTHAPTEKTGRAASKPRTKSKNSGR